MKQKLNLGCCRNILQGYVNLDMAHYPGVDVVHNLEKFPYPFKENTFDEILALMILEHLDDLVKTMKELHRISKPNAIIKIKVPYFSCTSNFIDPTHKRSFSYYSFDFLIQGNKYSDFHIDTILPRFRIRKRKIIFYSILKPLKIFFNTRFTARIYSGLFSYILPAGELYFELEVIK